MPQCAALTTLVASACDDFPYCNNPKHPVLLRISTLLMPCVTPAIVLLTPRAIRSVSGIEQSCVFMPDRRVNQLECTTQGWRYRGGAGEGCEGQWWCDRWRRCRP